MARDAKRARRLVVFVGVTATVPSPDKKFFIKMSKDDREVAYRRVIERELRKVADAVEGMIRAARETKDPSRISVILTRVFHVGAVNPTMNMYEYNKMYRGALAFEKSRCTPKTQAEIVAAVRAMVPP